MIVVKNLINREHNEYDDGVVVLWKGQLKGLINLLDTRIDYLLNIQHSHDGYWAILKD